MNTKTAYLLLLCLLGMALSSFGCNKPKEDTKSNQGTEEGAPSSKKAQNGPAKTFTLEGDWILKSLNGTTPAKEISLSFNSDGTLEGNGGCNQLSGKYFSIEEEKKLKFQHLGMTERACVDPPEANQQESDFFNLILATGTYSYEGTELTLTSPKGTLVFVQLPPLEGDWKVVELAGKPFGPLSLRIKNGEISGGAGCNSIYGRISFNHEKATLTLTELSITEVHCEATDPNEADLMKNEATYYGALSKATGYALEGDTLTLKSPVGDLVYKRK